MPDSSTPALELRDVHVVYERRGSERVPAVAGASLTVEHGQIVGLVGESGCGKSSLARAAVGLVRPTEGTVLFEGREVTALKRGARPKDMARLQMVFQNPYSSLGAKGARRGAARPRRAPGERCCSLPAPVQRGATAADRGRPCARG
jgi:peptide/nickel transport system ATP-binding protein